MLREDELQLWFFSYMIPSYKHQIHGPIPSPPNYQLPPSHPHVKLLFTLSTGVLDKTEKTD